MMVYHGQWLVTVVMDKNGSQQFLMIVALWYTHLVALKIQRVMMDY